MESIVQFRQMMADQKFLEVQKQIEVQLTLNNDSRHELLAILHESLIAQEKNLPSALLVELIEFESQNNNQEVALKLISDLSPADSQKYFLRIEKIKIKAAEELGQMDRLFDLISDFLLRQYEEQVPAIPNWITLIINKFFNNDFSLKLKELAISLLLSDLELSNKLTTELIFMCIERSSPKATLEKLDSIAEILKASRNKGSLELLQNFCTISVNGIKEKTDYKKIVEMVIFFDDFRMQTLILNLIHNLGHVELAQDYAVTVRANSEYNYVYFDKYFNHLKSYFFQSPKKTPIQNIETETPDLHLNEKINTEVISPVFNVEDIEEEKSYLNMIKYQTYSSGELCDLAVSFLQADMPRVALAAAVKSMSISEDDVSYLKGGYLKFSCELLTSDFRAALDTCFEALTRATTKDDILSFLYGEAEAYIRLNQKKAAKKILSKILAIDSNYRLAKERLEKLNAI